MKQDFTKTPLLVALLGSIACSSAEELEKRLANKDQAASSQSSISPNQTSTLTSASTSTQSAKATNSSTNTVPQSATDPTIETNTEPATSITLSLCPDGDGFMLQIPDPIKACMDQSRLWDFTSSQCTAMRKASFDCTFDALIQKLQDLNIRPSDRLIEAKNGIKGTPMILGCGESATRDTVLIQWLYQPQTPIASCIPSKGMLITGCYGRDSVATQLPTEDRKNAVLRCMNGMKTP